MKYVRNLWNALPISSGIVFLGITIFTCIDVLGRYLLSKPIAGALEIIMLVMPWGISLSFAYGLRKGVHPRMTLIVGRFPPYVQSKLQVFVNLAGLLFFGFLSYGAWAFFWESWQQNEVMMAALRTLPWWVGKLGLSVGFLFIAFQFLLDLMRVFRSKG